MVFSSVPFLYAFLPAVLLLYFCSPRWLRNPVLLLASLLFYAWGSGIFLLLLLPLIPKKDYLYYIFFIHISNINVFF